MRKEATFLASVDVARRAGVTGTNYRVKDGRYVISEKSLRSLRMNLKPEEYVNGLDVELVSESEALRLIKEAGYDIGEHIDSQEEDGMAPEAVTDAQSQKPVQSGQEAEKTSQTDNEEED